MFSSLPFKMVLRQSVQPICAPPNCLLDENKKGPLVEFMYLVFTCMPGESHCR